ncbi:MAG: hypothetical protein ACREKR_12185 [Candidatus Methylomirabilales bacterium]
MAGHVRLENEVVHLYLNDPIAAEKVALKYAKQKFRAAADAFYGPGA